MKLNVKILLWILLAMSSMAHGRIQELQSLRDLPVVGARDTWVIFDVDNTILRPTSSIGSHQWADLMRDEEIKKGIDPVVAGQRQHQYFSEVQGFVQVKLVEDDFLDVFADLRKSGVSIMALTARGDNLIATTLQQLIKVKVSFVESFPAQKDSSVIQSYVRDGVIFAGGKSKGEVLSQIIGNSLHPPRRVIFVDDKRYNLEAVEKAFQNSTVEILGLRYGAADPFLNVDKSLADLQYDFFLFHHVVLPDEKIRSLQKNLGAIVEARFSLDEGESLSPVGNCQEIGLSVKRSYKDHYFICRKIGASPVPSKSYKIRDYVGVGRYFFIQ